MKRIEREKVRMWSISAAVAIANVGPVVSADAAYRSSQSFGSGRPMAVARLRSGSGRSWADVIQGLMDVEGYIPTAAQEVLLNLLGGGWVSCFGHGLWLLEVIF